METTMIYLGSSLGNRKDGSGQVCIADFAQERTATARQHGYSIIKSFLDPAVFDRLTRIKPMTPVKGVIIMNGRYWSFEPTI